MSLVKCLGHHLTVCLLSTEEAPDWLLTDKVSSWPGTPSDRGWRYVRQMLERHDGLKTQWRYSQTVLEVLLSHDRQIAPPPWLVTVLEVISGVVSSEPSADGCFTGSSTGEPHPLVLSFRELGGYSRILVGSHPQSKYRYCGRQYILLTRRRRRPIYPRCHQSTQWQLGCRTPSLTRLWRLLVNKLSSVHVHKH
jgi:hypothetical protein